MSPPLPAAVARRRWRRLAAALALAVFFLAASGNDGSTGDRASTKDDEHASGLDLPVADSCVLCVRELPVPVVPLDPVGLDSVAHELAVPNERQISRIDSLYHAGAFGRPKGDEARRRAHLLARLTTTNCYWLLAHYACDTTRVYEADEATLSHVFRRYSDPSLFSIARLRRLRIGMGRVCLRYDISGDIEGESVLGGKPMHYKSKVLRLSGKKRRVLSIDLPTGAEAMVEVLLAEHYSCAVEHSFGNSAAGPYEAFLVHDIQGGWLRKWGTHRPTAFMFWVTSPAQGRLELPAQPTVGVRLYVPRLRLKLPFIIPDINFDDLRAVELPMPILEMAYLTEHRYPEGWLQVDSLLEFKNWVGQGPVPESLRERFPDR